MEDLFSESQLEEFIAEHRDISRELAILVYTSRLLGKEGELVLHGGGNTSVKLKQKNLMGEEQDLLFVKGSGHDLASITSAGFTGLELNAVKQLRKLESLSDEEMDNQLRISKIRADAPDPSVEALLHAFLPHKYVDHTHAGSILALANQKNGLDLIREVTGTKVAVLPYIASGLPLAKTVVETYEADPNLEAIIIQYHGIFTFGGDASASYRRMIEYVTKAEKYIIAAGTSNGLLAGHQTATVPKDVTSASAKLAQVLRGNCSHTDSTGRKRRLYIEIRNHAEIINLSHAENAQIMCQSGVLTPDHAIRTKNQAVYLKQIPDSDLELQKLVAEAVESFKSEYDEYFAKQSKEKGVARQKLDSLPRVIMAAGLGIFALGFTRKEARMAADIAEHTVRVKNLALSLGDYAAIDEGHVFEMEYWKLQQKKLARAENRPLEGQVAVVTGAGGAIGFGIADRLLHAGAVVAISDIDTVRLQKVQTVLAEKYGDTQVESIVFDVSDFQSVEKALAEISLKTGGIDIIVPNAGVAYVARIEELDPKDFDRVVKVNLMGTFNLIKAAIPILKRQGTGGNIVLISSKNVFDPGAAFGAYSASKAAAHQISKIAALELAEFGVRVNMINPDAVFGDQEISSKLWDLIGPDRMKSRGLDPEGLQEYYRQRNLLKVSVKAEHVGNAVVFFASEQTPTTGATLPVDGGIPAAFPK